MNKLDNGNRQKKNQVHVCPWPSSVSHLINKLIIETWESTNTFSFKWWNLVSFYHEIVLLENVDPDEREDGAKAVIFE